jgi:hypothetical protein
MRVEEAAKGAEEGATISFEEGASQVKVGMLLQGRYDVV